MCFAAKLCRFSQEESDRCYARTLPLLIVAFPRILSIHVVAYPQIRKCVNFDTEIRWHLYGKFTAKGWKLYGKNMARVRQKYGIYTERPLGNKISWNDAGLIIIFILRFTYNESIQ